MKRRLRLPIGLGVALVLTATVPAFATTTANPTPFATEVSADSTENKISAVWQQDKTEEHMDQWYISLTDNSDDPDSQIPFTGSGAYEVNGKTYFLKDGYLQTGAQKIESTSNETENTGSDTENDIAGLEEVLTPAESLIKGKTYYFSAEGTDPSRDDLGSLVTGENQWISLKENSQTKWFYVSETGEVDTSKTGYIEIDGSFYYLEEDGTAKTGEVEVNGVKYYFEKAAGGKRAMVTGWQILDGRLIYFNSNCEVANSGTNGWLNKFDHWYWFKDGVMQTGWQKIKNIWYYMDKNTGIMQTGWFSDGKATYYANSNGAMQTGWIKLNNIWYYLDPSGALQTGFYTVKDVRYFADENGAMKTGWQKIQDAWYYFNTNGAMQTGWIKLKNLWYYLDPSSGAMKTDWQKISGSWYYLDPVKGDMKIGWIKIKDTWYYLYSNGVMAANKWVGDYYLLGNGAMATNQWIGKYYVGEDGKWIPNYDPEITGGKWVKIGNTWYYEKKDGTYICNKWKKIDGLWYYFKPDGAMVTGWQYIGDYKYYFASSGKLMQDLDGILAKQSEYQITVNRQKCQVMVYAKDNATGKFNVPVKTFVCSVGMPDTPTPTGTYYTPEKMRWHTLMGPSYGQYCTRITPANQGILFHSVASPQPNNNCLPAAEYNKLGQPASHGCVRLCVRDAKWIYDNCNLNTKVTISDSEATPFDKPESTKIPLSQTWDPTDPNPPSNKNYL